jgi:hypothetical protein
MDKLSLGLVGRKIVQVYDNVLVLDDNTEVFVKDGQLWASKDGTEFQVEEVS